MQKLFIVFFCVAISIQAGCAARAYLRSNQAISNPFDKNAAIFLKAAETMTMEEANFMVLLREGIKKSELKLADDLSKADYVLFFTISEPTLLGHSLTYEPIMTAPYFMYEGPIYYYPVSYTYGYPGLKITVTIFKKENFLSAPRVPLWEASLVVKKDVYQDYSHELIKIILDHVGQRFEGRVKVP